MSEAIQYWNAPKIWNGRTVFIIAGGPSLKDMDWEPLKQQRVIGCNDAYMLGSWVDVCYFGDLTWYNKHGKALEEFSGLKVTCNPECRKQCGILILGRRPCGITKKPGHIGWNYNTGASAVNLAIIFGASRIVLLGYDMKRNGEQSNWYTNQCDAERPWFKNWKKRKEHYDEVFAKFKKWFGKVHEDWKSKFPDVEIINANLDSDLDYFPKMDRTEAMREYCK